MTLLNEIQNLATTPSYSLADLLRKCKILAARLGHEAFATWVNDELTGYKKDDSVPAYRFVETHSVGQFMGPGGVKFSNVPIQIESVPKQHRKLVQEIRLKQPIRSLEEQLSTDDAVFHVAWSSGLVATLRDNLVPKFQLVHASKMLARSVVVGAVDNVRTKVLDFALEIEKRDPRAGELFAGEQTISQSVVENVFRKIVGERIMGNTIHNNFNGPTHMGPSNFGSAAVVGSDNSTGVAQVGDENSAGVQNTAGVSAVHLMELIAAFRGEIDSAPEEVRRKSLPIVAEMEQEVSRPAWSVERVASLMKHVQTIYTVASPACMQLAHQLGPWLAAAAQGI